MNFLDTLEDLSESVRLGGVDYVARRARLGLFFVLEAIARRREPTAMLDYVAKGTGLPIETVGAASLEEVSAAYAKLRTLNALRWRYPFMTSKQVRDALDYEGRSLALIIHRLASSYGWTEQAILSLVPERAMFYVLEILVDRYQEQQVAYNLSSVGFDKKGKKQPYPSLGWIWPDGPRPNAGPAMRVSRERAVALGLIPAGVVIDLGGNVGN